MKHPFMAFLFRGMKNFTVNFIVHAAAINGYIILSQFFHFYL